MPPTHDGEQNRRIDRLETRVDKHDDRLEKQDSRIGALGGIVGKLTGEVDQQTFRLNRQGAQIDANSSQIDAIQAVREERGGRRVALWVALITSVGLILAAIVSAAAVILTGSP
jgi:hypothetical protein